MISVFSLRENTLIIWTELCLIFPSSFSLLYNFIFGCYVMSLQYWNSI